MTEKKPYSPPQLFRIELNHEQAILSACSVGTISVAQNGNGGCRPNVCKRNTAMGATNSGPNPS
jgi:hypothetical protein